MNTVLCFPDKRPGRQASPALVRAVSARVPHSSSRRFIGSPIPDAAYPTRIALATHRPTAAGCLSNNLAIRPARRPVARSLPPPPSDVVDIRQRNAWNNPEAAALVAGNRL